MNQQKLVDAAEKAMYFAYNPYSHFSVGAALLTADKEIICGANIENSSYGCTICAERAAISTANSKGKRDFTMIAVIASQTEIEIENPVAPCGICRQVISEFAFLNNHDIKIIMSNADKSKVIISSIYEGTCLKGYDLYH